MSAFNELRQNLVDAAQREVEAKRVRRRRKRRATTLVAAALIAGTAVAGAADLISVGEPFSDLPGQSDEYKPPPGSLRPTILAKAKSGDRLPYAVGVYTAKNGDVCVVAGALRGYTLGLVQGGKFRPYKQDRAGTCNSPDRPTFDSLVDGDRTIVYGRATAKRPRVTVTVEGKPTRPKLQKDRGFLLVYKGKLARTEIRIQITPGSPN